MTSDIKFEIQQGWGDFKIVWMMKYEGGKHWNGYMENGDVKWVEVVDGSDYGSHIPFMKLPRFGINMQGLVDALTNKIPTTKDIETTTELRATKYHLEDMRKLVFKGK